MKHILTDEQKIWLNNNYRLYSNYHLSIMMNVKQYVLENWLRKLSLYKRTTKIIALTDDQKAFIKDNYLRMTAERVAKSLGIAVCRVQNYARKNNLQKNERRKVNTKSKSIIPYKPLAKTFERPPAKYDNENVVDKYLNI